MVGFQGWDDFEHHPLRIWCPNPQEGRREMEGVAQYWITRGGGAVISKDEQHPQALEVWNLRFLPQDM